MPALFRMAVFAILLIAPAVSAADGIAIYTLADESIDFRDAAKVPLADLKLKPQPWISNDDIEFYDASAHIFFLKHPKPQTVHSVFGTPYVLMAGGERLFVGALWTSFSSALPEEGAVVIDDPGFITPADTIRLNQFQMYRRDGKPLPPNPMNDPRIQKTLERDGKFHAGLKCVFDKVETAYDAANRKTTVKYTYTLTNLDKENLYVLDPDKMGSLKYHYVNNGVYFYPANDNEMEPIHPKPPPPENAAELRAFNLENFVQIKSGASITRTVTLGSYPKFPPGTYTAHFTFNAPHKITREHRKQPDGRIWMGDLMVQMQVKVE